MIISFAKPYRSIGLIGVVVKTTHIKSRSYTQDVAKISVKAGNAAAVTLGTPFVNTFSSGVSFTVTYPSSAAGTEVYYYEIE